MNVSAIAKIAVVAVALAFGQFALTMADASTIDVQHDQGPLILLAFAFFVTLGMLAYASLAPDIRLSTQVLLIYMAIYLILPGYNHNSVNLFPFFSLSYPGAVRFDGALIVLLFVLSFSIGTLSVTAKPVAGRSAGTNGFQTAAKITPNVWLAVALTFVAAAAAVVYLVGVGVGFAFSPRVVESNLYLSRSNAGLVIATPRVLTLLVLTYALTLIRFSTRPRVGWHLLLVNLPFILTTNFPPALPRSQVFGILLLISVFLVDYSKVRSRATLSIAFVGGATLGMPLLDHFTRGQGTLSNLNMRNIFKSYFKSGDFDGLQSINNAVIYVQMNGLEMGHQLFSALLFFIPRAMWHGKADPSGSIAGDAAGYTFLNVSMPLPGEIFIDFGFTGLVAIGITVGWGMALLDRHIDRVWSYDLRGRLLAAVMVAYALPIYRGSLLGVIAPFATILVAFFVIGKLGMRPAKNVTRRRDTSELRPIIDR